MTVFSALPSVPIEHLDQEPTPRLRQVFRSRAAIARFALDLLDDTLSPGTGTRLDRIPVQFCGGRRRDPDLWDFCGDEAFPAARARPAQFLARQLYEETRSCRSLGRASCHGPATCRSLS
jgi:hypothetical protein